MVKIGEYITQYFQDFYFLYKVLNIHGQGTIYTSKVIWTSDKSDSHNIGEVCQVGIKYARPFWVQIGDEGTYMGVPVKVTNIRYSSFIPRLEVVFAYKDELSKAFDREISVFSRGFQYGV